MTHGSQTTTTNGELLKAFKLTNNCTLQNIWYEHTWLAFACPFSFIILTLWIFPMFTYSSSTSCSTCKNTMVRRMKDSSLKKLLDIHIQNSNLFHSLEIILTKENNFLPHVPPPMLYHLPTYMPYHMSSIVSTIMGVLLLQAMHLCLSREPTSWTLCAINPHIHAPWFASWTCHKIFPQYIYIYIYIYLFF